MKAFVIKNKEGKYCQITFNGWINFVSELYCAYIYYSKQGAEKIIKCHELEDCEVVEITIAEGDLQKENEVLRKALELACEEYSDNSEYCCEADCRCNGYKKCSECLTNKFIDQAKKEINND